MLILVTYDVCTENSNGRKRLRKIAKECVNYGQRVQNSVFECELDSAQYEIVKNKLLNIMNKDEDSLRLYNLGNHTSSCFEHFGTKDGYKTSDVLII